jgi:Rrf2 family nitric oxide-sensitive transcriptional repressor
MHLTTFTDYSIRVLLYVGLKDGARTNIAEIADAYGISRNHLMKVVHGLSQRGYIATVRGKGGGLKLARDPETISIGEVVRASERDISLAPCFAADGIDCFISDTCGMRSMLHEALDEFLKVLDRYTLADLLLAPDGLAEKLGLVDPDSPCRGQWSDAGG